MRKFSEFWCFYLRRKILGFGFALGSPDVQQDPGPYPGPPVPCSYMDPIQKLMYFQGLEQHSWSLTAQQLGPAMLFQTKIVGLELKNAIF